jgi:hypothetical protein
LHRKNYVDKCYYVRQTDQVTDITFGGVNMDCMIVTTASVDFFGRNKRRDRRDDRRQDQSGCLLQIRNMSVRGQDNNRFVWN